MPACTRNRLAPILSESQGPSLAGPAQWPIDGSATHLRVMLLAVGALALVVLGALHAGQLRLGHVAVTGGTGFLGVHMRLATLRLRDFAIRQRAVLDTASMRSSCFTLRATSACMRLEDMEFGLPVTAWCLSAAMSRLTLF